jgi:PIN domain nuclease of toxin-antitoxin system
VSAYLLDTHVLVWLTFAPENLGASTLGLLEGLDTKVYVSAATFWEIAQKRAAKRLRFDLDISASLVKHQLLELPISGAHCEAAANLPPIHKDPFDRLLVAQALSEGLVLVTRDKLLAAYNVPMVRV